MLDAGNRPPPGIQTDILEKKVDDK